jgi:hypothetical protein
MAKNTTNQTVPAQTKPELENQETINGSVEPLVNEIGQEDSLHEDVQTFIDTIKEEHKPRQLSAADFRPFFPESSGNCVLLWGANSLEICEDKGFKPTITIPYTQDWLNFVSQKIHVTISDSFKKADNELETFTSKKTANVYGGYLITCSLNGTLERSNTNFYRKQTGKDESGKAKYGNTTEVGLERVAAAMSANDLSPATFGQEKKTAFVWAKFIQSIDEQTKSGGTLAHKAQVWQETKKRYPTSRLLEAAILRLKDGVDKEGNAHYLKLPLYAFGYTDPVEIQAADMSDLS